MTTQTEDLIKKFSMNGDLNFVPGIIIGMQEEDNVGNAVHFKNCFRQLRNLAAHEPATIVSQIKAGTNSNSTKIVLVSQIEKNTIGFSIEQFTAWMFDMHVITGNIAYLVFWKSMLKVLYPNVYNESLMNTTFKFGSDTTKLLSEFGRVSEYLIEQYGELWHINIKDEYVANMFKTNPKVFWRMAIPNMFVIIKLYLNGLIDIRNRDNINMYLAFFTARE